MAHNGSMIDGKTEYKFATYLAVAYFIYMCSHYVGASSHASRSIMYFGIGLPTLYFIFRHFSACLHRLKPFIPLAAFLIVATLAECFALYGDPIKIGRYSAYLLLLGLSLSVLCRFPALLSKLFVAYALASVAYLLLALYIWAAADQSTRVLIGDLNVTRSALLTLCGLFAGWLFYAERRLLERGTVAYAAGFTLFGLATMLTALVFQSRSGMVSILLFLFIYALYRKRATEVIGISIAAAILLVFTGWYRLLLIRGTSYRTDIWADLAERVWSHCGLLFGCGSADTATFAENFLNPHSGYLSTLYYHGVFAMVAFLIFAVFFFHRAWKVRTPFLLIAMPGWGGGIASSSGFIDGPEPQWVYFWIPSLIALCLAQRSPVGAPNKNALHNVSVPA